MRVGVADYKPQGCRTKSRVEYSLLVGLLAGFAVTERMDYAGWVSSKLAMRASASRKDASRERPSRFV